MLPVLRGIYERGKSESQLTSLALTRIYELSPDEGRRLILEEMRQPSPRVNIQTLTLLPDETLPEVDALVEERAGDDKFDSEILLQLAQRYASSAVAAKLRATYEEKIGRFACLPQKALLQYFLRVDPDSAIGMVEKAIDSREATGCFRFLLTDIAKTRMNPELEKIAVSTLNDSDTELVLNAVEMLGQYGSKDSRDVLLRRFEEWHEVWDGRERELAKQQQDDMLKAQVRVEAALLRSLANSPAWLADEELLTKLRSLCVSRSCIAEADSLLQQFGTNITGFFEWQSSKVATASIGQYNVLPWDQLKIKVLQYPKGTTFSWSSDRPDSGDDQGAFNELRNYLEKHEMKLRRFEADKKVRLTSPNANDQ